MAVNSLWARPGTWSMLPSNWRWSSTSSSIGVSEVTVAERGLRSSRESSPKYWPGRRVAILRPALLTAARPPRMRKNSKPGLPSSHSSRPESTATSSDARPMRPSSFLVQVENSQVRPRCSSFTSLRAMERQGNGGTRPEARGRGTRPPRRRHLDKLKTGTDVPGCPPPGRVSSAGLSRHRPRRRLRRRRVAQVGGAARRQIVVEVVDAGDAGGDVEGGDVLVRDALEVLDERPQAVAVGHDEHPSAGPEVGDDGVVPVREHPQDDVPQTLRRRYQVG